MDRIWEAGEQTYEILKAYTKAASNQHALKTVRITFHAQFVDKYKNSVGIRPILTLRFDASEAMKYNFEHSYPTEMVDTASIEFLYPLEKNAPQRYCDGNGKFSPMGVTARLHAKRKVSPGDATDAVFLPRKAHNIEAGAAPAKSA